MAFTVEGSIRGCKYSISYEGPGKLSGDRLAIDLVKITAKRSYLIGPVGMAFEGDYLADPLATLVAIQNTFTRIDKIKGDAPTAEAEENVVY